MNTNNTSAAAMKTRTVRFSYNTCKDVALLVPAEPANLYQVSELILQSYFDYMFSRGALMSDEVLVSSIGKSSFFGGALGGWKTRLNEKEFAALENLLVDSMIAVAVVQYRDSSISRVDAYRIAAKNEALTADDRRFLNDMAELSERLEASTV